MYDVIIIGAGPAGMTAAIYLRRANKTVLILEAKTYGGQIINTLDIENYPVMEHISGFDFATKLYDQVGKMGAEFKFLKAEKIIDLGEDKEVVTSEGVYIAKTIIIATGLENRKLGIKTRSENKTENGNDGEKSIGEKLVGRGISYCATCDGAFYKNKNVAVVGGGNTALEDALYLSDLAEKVYLIHRRDEFRGEAKLVEQIKKRENIELVLNSTIFELEAGEKLKAVVVENIDGMKKRIEIDGLFVAIGQIPENKNFADIVMLDDAGYVISGEDCKTNVEGIFVAGDNRTKEVRQLVTATADGATAAMSAVKYLNNLNQ